MSGISVLLIDTKHRNPNHYIVLSILESLQHSPLIKNVKKCEYKDVVREARAAEYDILLAVDAEAVNNDIIRLIRPLVKCAVLWVWEDPYERRITTKIADLFDLIYTNDAGSTNFYKNGAKHLPLAATTYLPVRSSDQDFDYDLSFIGTAWPNRVLFLRRLLRRLPHIKPRIILNYNPHIPRTYLDLPESSYIGSVSHPDFLSIINRTRVNLTLHRSFSSDGVNRKASTPGPRIFEAALAGGFQLVDASDTAIDDFYTPQIDIETFSSFEEGVEKIEALINDTERRTSAAISAQTRTAANHTYNQRIATILRDAEHFLHNAQKQHPGFGITHSQSTLRRPRVLLVTHSDTNSKVFGGVEVYQEILIDTLSDRYEFWRFQPTTQNENTSTREFKLVDASGKISQVFSVPYFNSHETLSQTELEEIFAHILVSWNIDIVHFQHLINLAPSLPLIAKILGIPSVFNVHDFWSICTRFNLLDYKGSYCQIAGRPITVCDVCLSSSDDETRNLSGAQAYRRNFFSRVLLSFDKILFASETSMNVLRGVYPELRSKQFVKTSIPSPSKHSAARYAAASSSNYRSPKLQVLFFGNFTYGKGADTFLEVLQHIEDDSIEFTIKGRIDERYKKALKRHRPRNVKIHGDFRPGEVDLSKFDVSLHLSIWPETYCITLSEAWAVGIVPIVTSIGALDERVDDNVTGYKVPVAGAGEIISILRRITGDRGELHQIKANIKENLWTSPQDHSKQMDQIYTELGRQFPIANSLGYNLIETGARTNLDIANISLSSSLWTSPPPVTSNSVPLKGYGDLNPLAPIHSLVTRAIEENLVFKGAPWVYNIEILDVARNIAAQPRQISIIIDRGAGQNVSIAGWIKPPANSGQSIALMARSITNDIIIRPLELRSRGDLNQIGAPWSFGWGFSSLPIPSDLLDIGAYSLSFIQTKDDGTLDAQDLSISLLSVSETSPLLLYYDDLTDPIAVPILMKHSPSIEAHTPVNVIHFVEDARIINVPNEAGIQIDFLYVRGWLITDKVLDVSNSSQIKITGRNNYSFALSEHDRADVSLVHQERMDANSAAIGFNGRAWLTGFPAGTYELRIAKDVGGSIIEICIGSLVVGSAESSLELNEAPTMSRFPKQTSQLTS